LIIHFETFLVYTNVQKKEKSAKADININQKILVNKKEDHQAFQKKQKRLYSHYERTHQKKR